MQLPIFKVERWINEYETRAAYELAETDIKAFTLRELLSFGDLEAAKEDLLNTRLAYNPTTGSDGLRSAIASLHNESPDNVLITTGAIEANFHVANALVEPGDTVVVQFPAYQALYATAEARGATVKFWRMRYEDKFEPDIDELRKLIDNRTKLVVLNIPHNPTGAVISEDQLRTILRWAEDEGFYVLCDEVYHELETTEGVVPPYARTLSERAISVGSMSKAYGLSGLRLGWIVGPEELIQECWEWKDYTSISNTPLSDYLATFAFRHYDKIRERNISIARSNHRTLLEWLKEHEGFFDYVMPKAGVLCFPKLKNVPISSEQLCREVFEQHKLLLVPGECFEMPGHLRIGFGGDSERLKIALGLLSEYLNSHFRPA